MPKRTDGRPRHQQIASDLRARIMDGDLTGQLPFIKDLMASYEVGSPTIQRALKVLKAEGLLSGRRGEGVFVQPHKPLVIDAAAYLDPKDGYTYKILEVAEAAAPAKVAREFDIEPGEPVVLRKRIMYFHEDPVELSWSYYPADIARGTRLTDPRKIPGGAPALLESLGVPELPGLDDYFSSRPPTTEEIEMLDLPDDATVLRQFRVIRTHDRRPIEVSVLVKGGHLRELHVVHS